MSKKSEFKGLIQVMDDRSIRWFNTDKIQQFLKDHPNERFEFVIKKYRTPQQNKYYHVLVGIMAERLNMSHDEMHEIIRYKFLTQEYVHEETGEVFSRMKSTKELSKFEMADLIERLKMWAAQTFSLYLPEPNEQQEMDM